MSEQLPEKNRPQEEKKLEAGNSLKTRKPRASKQLKIEEMEEKQLKLEEMLTKKPTKKSTPPPQKENIVNTEDIIKRVADIMRAEPLHSHSLAVGSAPPKIITEPERTPSPAIPIPPATPIETQQIQVQIQKPIIKKKFVC